MSTIVQDLLTNFYGIGCENTTKVGDGSSFSSIHEGLNSVDSQSFQNLSSGDQNTSLNDDNLGILQSLDKSVVDNSEEDFKTATSRSWRALDDDEDLQDEEEEEEELNEPDLQDEDAVSNVLNIKEVDEVDGRKASLLVKPIIPGTLDGRHESPRARQPASAFAEALQDTSSDISSRSARRQVKKTPLVIPLAKEKNFIPPVIKPTLSSVTSKTPIFNELFCDMANMSVEEVPLALLDKISNVKMIYLENNNLKELPSELFEKLKFLQWLDVRNNQLQTLPSSIKNHNCLETILLQGNQIERLPLEICLIPNLKSIHLANNPLVFPDMDVVALGFKAVINCLRNVWNKEHPDEIKNAPEATKSFMTILCQEPPAKLFTKRRKLYDYSPIKYKNMKKISTRERSKNYKPNNRCRINGSNKLLEEKFMKMCRLREALVKQNSIIQKIKDKNTLKNWRQDRRSYEKSMKKAAELAKKDLPYGVFHFNNQQSNQYYKKLLSPDINKRMSNVIESLRQLQIGTNSNIPHKSLELNKLHVGMKKLENIKQEIKELMRENETSLELYHQDDSLMDNEQYKPLPSII